jgi:hypothetical protein
VLCGVSYRALNPQLNQPERNACEATRDFKVLMTTCLMPIGTPAAMQHTESNLSCSTPSACSKCSTYAELHACQKNRMSVRVFSLGCSLVAQEGNAAACIQCSQGCCITGCVVRSHSKLICTARPAA